MKKLMLMLVILFAFSCVTVGQDSKTKIDQNKKEISRLKDDIKLEKNLKKSDDKRHNDIIDAKEFQIKNREEIIKTIEKEEKLLKNLPK
jgi:hypothetical protein